MAAEQANIWDNFSYGSRIYAPIGCLLNPEGSRLIFFERSRIPIRYSIKIYTHLFYTNHLGEPAGYKYSNKVLLEEAWNKWHKLQEQGWTEVSHSFG